MIYLSILELCHHNCIPELSKLEKFSVSVFWWWDQWFLIGNKTKQQTQQNLAWNNGLFLSWKRNICCGSHAIQATVLEVVPSSHKNRKWWMCGRVFLQHIQQIKVLPGVFQKSNPKQMKLWLSQDWFSLRDLLRFPDLQGIGSLKTYCNVYCHRVIYIFYFSCTALRSRNLFIFRFCTRRTRRAQPKSYRHMGLYLLLRRSCNLNISDNLRRGMESH